jgi:ribosomal protein L31
LICQICNNILEYQSTCDPQDINLDINGDITIYICNNCGELFNLIHNHDTDEIKLEHY